MQDQELDKATEEKLTNAIITLQNIKATEPDSIPNEMIKNSHPTVIKQITSINVIMKLNYFLNT